MNQFVLTPNEARVLRAIGERGALLLSQLTVSARLLPHEAREVIGGLEAKGLVKLTEGGKSVQLTEGRGRLAFRVLSRQKADILAGAIMGGILAGPPGAMIGSFLAGPPGAMIGSFVGGLFGRFHEDEEARVLILPDEEATG